MLPAPTSSPLARLGRAEHAILVLAVVLCRVLAVRCCPTYDDAFITYRYALNFAQGLGLVYNPGAEWEPVLGTTTPLYALVLAPFARLGLDLVLVSLCLNIALDAATAVLIPRLFGSTRTRAVFALLAFAALPQLVRISVGGMETPLFVFTGVAASVALATGWPVLAGLAAAAACLVRPEGVLLVAVLFVARIRAPAALARFALPVLAIGMLSVFLLSITYGSPIPQSVLAKSTMHAQDALGETLARWRTILAESFAPSWVLVPCLPLIVYGALMSLARPGALRTFSLWALGITAAYLAARPHTWGWYYGVPLTAWTLWFGLGAERACGWIAPRIGPRILSAARVAGAPIGAALAVTAAGCAAWKFPTPVDAAVYAPLRAFAADVTRREPAARILASDIGAIGWGWRGVVLDSEGLVWPEALRLKHPNAIVEALQPEYVLLVAERPRLAHFQERPDLYARYEPIARFSARGETALAPRLEELRPEWTQDYIVYRRKAP